MKTYKTFFLFGLVSVLSFFSVSTVSAQANEGNLSKISAQFSYSPTKISPGSTVTLRQVLSNTSSEDVETSVLMGIGSEVNEEIPFTYKSGSCTGALAGASFQDESSMNYRGYITEKRNIPAGQSATCSLVFSVKSTAQVGRSWQYSGSLYAGAGISKEVKVGNFTISAAATPTIAATATTIPTEPVAQPSQASMNEGISEQPTKQGVFTRFLNWIRSWFN